MLIELGAAEELSNFLLSDATPDDCMDIVMLDGFLTSLVCSPAPVPPSEWTPVIWGTGRPVFASTAHANRIVQLIAQQMKGIADTLRDYPEIFLPLIDSTPDGSPDLESGEDWCIGFMNGVELREEAWQPLLENAAAEEIMIPVTLLALHGAAPETLEEKIDDPVIYAASLQLLPEAVTGIYQYWHGQKKGQGVSLPSAKIGRNEPCPCGSGKKFKKCCGMR